MSALKPTSKGRITIPASIRASIGIVNGTRIEFVEIENGKFIIVPTLVSIQSLKGDVTKTTNSSKYWANELSYRKSGSKIEMI